MYYIIINQGLQNFGAAGRKCLIQDLTVIQNLTVIQKSEEKLSSEKNVYSIVSWSKQC